jgi:protein-S-isoprenylcysteine O-methyltransferase Ste14
MMLQTYIAGVWIAVGLVWLVMAVAGGKRTSRKQSAASRTLHLAAMVVAFGLIFSARFRPGPLGWRWAPESAALEWAGLALTVAGCAMAVWARLILGTNWSGTVTVKQGHELIRRGPYQIVRHPIYSGGLLALLGTALACGEIGALAGVALAFIGWRAKARAEEAFMTQEFGDEYVRYRREVKALIPFVL